MTSLRKTKIEFPTNAAQSIEEKIKAFAHTIPLNRLPNTDNHTIFDEPLVQFADGDELECLPFDSTKRHLIRKQFGITSKQPAPPSWHF